MGTLIAIIGLGVIGAFLAHYMREGRSNGVDLVLGKKYGVALWMRLMLLLALLMLLACFLGAYFGEDQQVKRVIVPVSLIVIWLPFFGLIYYSSLTLTLTESYLERRSFFGKKQIPYEQIAKVESLAQGMYALHLKSKKRVVIEPIFKQSPKIKSYLQDVAYENRSQSRQKRRSRE